MPDNKIEVFSTLFAYNYREKGILIKKSFKNLFAYSIYKTMPKY